MAATYWRRRISRNKRTLSKTGSTEIEINWRGLQYLDPIYGMQSGSGQHGVLPKIPVFVFPPTLDFYMEDHKTHKRVLTIYNPYDFDVKFKVLCTCPDKYKVIESEGSIRAQCQIDLVVRHLALASANCNVTDKFRIRVLNYDTKQVLGQRDVQATLHMGLPDRDDDDRGSSSGSSKSVERRQSSAMGSGEWKSSKHFHSQQELKEPQGSISPIILFCGLVCIVALLLPNEGEVSSIPLSIPSNMKLVFSYVLGLVTMVIFRS